MKNKETTMTLDSPSNTGRPGLDELVPSRYALKYKRRSENRPVNAA